MGKGIQGLSLEEVNFEFTKDRTVILSNVVATSHTWVFKFKKKVKLKVQFLSPTNQISSTQLPHLARGHLMGWHKYKTVPSSQKFYGPALI